MNHHTPTPATTTLVMGVGAAGRVFEHRRVWRLPASSMRRACTLLAAAADRHAAAAHREPISTVIGIARGGTTPARRIAAALGLTARSVRAQHNSTDAPYAAATGTVSCDTSWLRMQPGERFAGTVLLVDDICGTGATFTAVRDALHAWAEPATRFLTCALCRNRAAATLPTLPDLYCWEVADWVVFPWEAPPEHPPTTPLPSNIKVISRD